MNNEELTSTVAPENVATIAECHLPPLSEDALPWWQRLGSLICAKNPFYLISALLIIYAQSAIFTADPLMPKTEIPASILAGYTVLLAAVAVLIVRAGKVWDDARSILLLVLLLLQVLPVCTDGMLLNTPTSGRIWQSGIFLLAVLVSELLRRGLKLRVPALLLTVYYAFFLFLCGWPLLLAEIVQYYEKNTMPALQTILLFPVVAAVLLLALIPIVRRGPEEFAANGTPWKWPYFPWSAFAVIVAGVAFRTFLLTISFVGGKGAGPYSQLESGFRPWMLIPLLFSLAVLLTEHVTRHGAGKAVHLLQALPFLILVLCLPFNPSSAAQVFYHAIPGGYGPFSIALPATIILTGWMWYRGIKGADVLFHILLGTLAAVTMANRRDHDLTFLPYWLNGAAFITDMAVTGWRRRFSGYSFVAVIALLYGLAVQVLEPDNRAAAIIAGTILLNFYLHGAVFRDRFAAACATLAAAAIPLYTLTAIIILFDHPSNQTALMAATVIVVLQNMAVYGFFRINRTAYRNSLIGSALILLGAAGIQVFKWIREIRIKVPWAAVWSALALVVAVLISLYKGGKLSAHARKSNRED